MHDDEDKPNRLTCQWGSLQCWSDQEPVYNDLYHTAHSSDQHRRDGYPERDT